MKSYIEMADSVFRRRDEYEAVQKGKKKKATKAIVSVCCCCLAAVIGVGTWQLSTRDVEILQSGNNAVSRLTEKNSYGKDIILINELEGVSSSKLDIGIDLSEENFVSMSREELCQYYQTEIFPDVPLDLNEWKPEKGYGVYTIGEKIYWDVTVINYSNDDFTRSVNIEIEKDTMPLSDYGELSPDCDKSIIKGKSVAIGKTENGYYVVEFICNNVGFRMITEGLSQEETVSIIASLIS